MLKNILIHFYWNTEITAWLTFLFNSISCKDDVIYIFAYLRLFIIFLLFCQVLLYKYFGSTYCRGYKFNIIYVSLSSIPHSHSQIHFQSRWNVRICACWRPMLVIWRLLSLWYRDPFWSSTEYLLWMFLRRDSLDRLFCGWNI